MPVGLLTVHLYLPGCTSLKEKRSRLKPILSRLHREFNVATAEMYRQDQWQESEIACATVSNDALFTQQVLAKIVVYIENNWPDETILDHKLEVI